MVGGGLDLQLQGSVRLQRPRSLCDAFSFAKLHDAVLSQGAVMRSNSHYRKLCSLPIYSSCVSHVVPSNTANTVSSVGMNASKLGAGNFSSKPYSGVGALVLLRVRRWKHERQKSCVIGAPKSTW